MIIRIASVEEMKKLWDYSNSNTYNYFVDGIVSGNIEFWTIEEPVSKNLIGELYIFWNSEDNDEADGINRAYLCALRVHKEYQGIGLSSKLMVAVKERIKDNGFTEVTIGIDNNEYERLGNIYSKWGFTDFVKKSYSDLHYRDKNNKPVIYEKPIDLKIGYL